VPFRSTVASQFRRKVRNRVQERRRQDLLVACVLAFLLVLAGGYSIKAVFFDGSSDRAVPKGPELCAPGVVKTGSAKECIGIVNETPYSFSPEVKDLVGKIAQENRQVRRLADRPEHGNAPAQYVRIALMMPMTSGNSSAMTADQIVDTLQGAYAAQYRTNHVDQPKHGTRHLIQLLVANQGLNQDRWSSLVPQFARMTKAPHPLVAVTGLGISNRHTADAAKALSKRAIPVVASVVTATDIAQPYLFKMSPGTDQQIKALHQYLTEHPLDHDAFLVYDARKDDNYVQGLAAGLRASFPEYQLARGASYEGSSGPGTEPPGQFASVSADICTAQPRTIFFAGRFRDLHTLVTALNGRSACGKKIPITIVTVTTGLDVAYSEPGFLADLSRAKLTLLGASTAAVTDWLHGRSVPQGFDDFRSVYLKTLHYPVGSLNDGYAILEHDAIRFAVRAAEYGATAKHPPTVASVYRNLVNMRMYRVGGYNSCSLCAVGASGTFGFDDFEHGKGLPHGRPIPVTQIPGRAYTTPVYTTPVS
jgi:ABC-type branched-subunit amino acid transport system substrate-binding protein